jgi:hypothetical protein
VIPRPFAITHVSETVLSTTILHRSARLPLD